MKAIGYINIGDHNLDLKHTNFISKTVPYLSIALLGVTWTTCPPPTFSFWEVEVASQAWWAHYRPGSKLPEREGGRERERESGFFKRHLGVVLCGAG